MKEELTRIEAKIDRIDEKLDNHLERIAKAETSLEGVRGSIKIGLTLILTIAGWLISKAKGLF